MSQFGAKINLIRGPHNVMYSTFYKNKEEEKKEN